MRVITEFRDLSTDPRVAANDFLVALSIREQTANLDSLVRKFGDCDLLEVDIEGDGYCLPAGMLSEKSLIVVRPRERYRDQYRRRFTLAHELGHLLCHVAAHHLEADAEERWCDQFASELLMPRFRVEKFARSVKRPADWLGFMEEFEASKSAAAIKLWQYCRVVLAFGDFAGKFTDMEYRRTLTELQETAKNTARLGDHSIVLSDGTAAFLRRGKKNFIAAAQVEPAPGKRVRSGSRPASPGGAAKPRANPARRPRG